MKTELLIQRSQKKVIHAFDEMKFIVGVTVTSSRFQTHFQICATNFWHVQTFPGSTSRPRTAQVLNGLSSFPAKFELSERIERFGRFFGKTAQTVQILLQKTARKPQISLN